MRVEWKTVQLDKERNPVLRIHFEYELLFFFVFDSKSGVARYGRLSRVERPHSVTDQVAYLLKQFKDEGAGPEVLMARIVTRKNTPSEVSEFAKAISSYRLSDAQMKRVDDLNAMEFRFSALSNEFAMRKSPGKTLPATEERKGGTNNPVQKEVKASSDKSIIPFQPPNKRVLLVEDSPTVQKLLQRIYSQIPGVSIVGIEDSVSGALRFINSSKVDLISLDMKLKDGTGVEFLRKINFPRKSKEESIDCILVTDCSPSEGNLVLDAISLGATAYLQKPQVKELDAFSEELASLIEGIVAKIDKKESLDVPRLKTLNLSQFSVIAIGSSTGGTEVVADLIQNLPRDCPPILIVQHMPPDFTRLYAERLTRQTGRKTNEVTGDQILERGQAYLGSGGHHMITKKLPSSLHVLKTEGEPVNRFKPSVSVLFKSIVDQGLGSQTLAIMLTGMGNDGAAEMLTLKNSGAVTIGQSKESCAVYGMPRAAAEMGALCFVASPPEIVRALNQFTTPAFDSGNTKRIS